MAILDKLAAGGAALALMLPGLPSAADVKIGVVDQQLGIRSTDEGKQALKTLEKLAEQKKAEMKPSQEAFMRKQEEFESQKFVLSDAAREERLLELEKERRELERNVQQVRDELQVQELKLTKPIVEKWKRAVSELGREKGFDVILDNSTPGILYHSNALDVTDLVIQRVNKDVTAGAAQ
jgi:outer membrane protein